MMIRQFCLLMLLSFADGFTVPGSVFRTTLGRSTTSFDKTSLDLALSLKKGVTPKSYNRHANFGTSGVVCQATSTTVADDQVSSSSADIYACPQCQTPTTLKASSCSNCGAPFKMNSAGFTDLTPDATATKKKATNTLSSNPLFSSALASAGVQLPGMPVRQELFRSPFVSFLYERGWREGFNQAGFPGIEKEFDMVMEYFKDAENKTVMDLSCGSGLMVRRIAKSKKFAKVIAVDFSESMLQEVARRSKEEACPPFDLVRADVQRMPFQDESVDAIHSGAALHCWPSVQDGLKEVHRVLKPGGSFFATTFLWGIPDEAVNLAENLSAPGRGGRRAYRFFSPKELEWLMKSAGFSEVDVQALSRCGLIRCKK